jgi:hypothetical protein
MQFLSLGKKLYYEEKYYILKSRTNFVDRFKIKWNSLQGIQLKQFIFFFFNFFFHFLNWPGVLQQRKVRPYFPCSWEIRDSSIFFSFSISFPFLFLFFFYFVGSLQCFKERLSQHQIPSHQKWEKFTSSKVFYIWSGREMYLLQLTSSKII